MGQAGRWAVVLLRHLLWVSGSPRTEWLQGCQRRPRGHDAGECHSPRSSPIPPWGQSPQGQCPEERVSGPLSKACGYNVQECFSSSSTATSKCPPAHSQGSSHQSPLLKWSISFLVQTPEGGGRLPCAHAQETWFQIPGLLIWVIPGPRCFAHHQGLRKCL